MDFRKNRVELLLLQMFKKIARQNGINASLPDKREVGSTADYCPDTLRGIFFDDRRYIHRDSAFCLKGVYPKTVPRSHFHHHLQRPRIQGRKKATDFFPYGFPPPVARQALI